MGVGPTLKFIYCTPRAKACALNLTNMAIQGNVVMVISVLAVATLAVSGLRVVDKLPQGSMNTHYSDLKIPQQELANPAVYPSRVTQISWKPRAFVYRRFLTDEECDHLISLAKSELKRSAVADNDSGNSAISEVRTSSGMFIPKGKDAIITRIEDKIAAWTFLPKENGEDMQVLRYEPGQKYDPHFDYFQDKINIVRGGHRFATVLMYLTDVEKGGETVFPLAEDDTRHRVSTKDDTLSDCAKKGAAVKPKRGDALLFFSLTPSANTDPKSLHAGCPVIQGEKWSATKWIHVESFDKPIVGSEKCVDENDRCGEWAAYGECMNNSEYMVGSASLPGACRKSCKVC